MPEFTTTGLVSLLIRVLQDEAPHLVRQLDRPDPMDGAILPDGLKRHLVDRVAAEQGTGLLLSVGQHLKRADETPTFSVLARRQSPQTLAGKWMRLERYFHSSHRTRIEMGGTNAWACIRESEGAPASQGENCLIAGVLLGLASLIGLEQVRLEIGGAVYTPEALRAVNLPPEQTVSRFRILWSGQAQGDTAFGREADHRPISDRLADTLAGDIGRVWKIADAARLLALSSRSLQRRLTAEQRTFSGVLRRARMRVATRYLSEGQVGLAEIGYCCGYADQAHFQRDFLRAANVTPGVFRTLARGGQPGAG